jgi:hypothetical protein
MSRTLLGGLAPRDFLRRYWQKSPLLVRGALPRFADPVEPRLLQDPAEIVLFGADGEALAYSKPERQLWQDVAADSVKLARLADLGSPALGGLMKVFGAGTIGRNFDF